MLAIIGGSGLTSLGGLERVEPHNLRTPWGETSAPLIKGLLRGREVVFLARHGDPHRFAPHRVNYRANLWALKEIGVEAVAAVATVGGIRRDLGTGALLVPDQIIDYTSGRPSSYYDGPEVPVQHIDFTYPYAAAVRERILEAARRCGEPVFDGGVYGATQGPRLETAAEINRMERDGADVVGMTGMPEAALARELDLPYASIAVVVNHAAGREDSAQGIELARLEAVLKSSIQRVLRIVETMVAA